MKEGGNINILLLGDEGVGKSSLASTFVSRHFSKKVPGILTRVRLPPDPSLFRCTTTIIDTQGGDITLSNALSLSVTNRGSFASIHASNADSISTLDGGENVVSSALPASDDLVSAEGLNKNRRDSPLTSLSSKNESVAAHVVATSPFRNIDAIILVYNLDRIETFHRLEHHWLPLIDQSYNGDMPVIVAGNKMDLESVSDHSPTRQQIISLLQRFKFVRQCVKCSAKNLLNVDEAFLKSQQSVVYPIGPLYDLNSGRLSAACSRAITRIFRMYMDKDGLLSDAELNAFQQEIWGVSLTERDFSGWKKMITEHDSGRSSGAEEVDTIRDGKFTLKGFLAIFDVLITSQNRLEVPWKVLRTMGYDDDLNLNIPASISLWGGKDWRLTSSDIAFLTGIFLQSDSDGDGILSSTDIHSIFSVLSCPHAPWGERGTSLFQDCFSIPCVGDEEVPPASPGDDVPFGPAIDSPPTSRQSSPSSRITASGITISSSPLPSVDISKDSESQCIATLSNHKPLSFLSWMNHWHMICTISPSIARAEMYRLGCNFERKTPLIFDNLSRVSRVTSYDTPAISMPSIFVRALILGSKHSGKRGLVQKLHRLKYSHLRKDETEYPATSCSVSKITWPRSNSSTTQKSKEIMVHVILTEVPSLDMAIVTEKRNLRNKFSILLGQEKSSQRPYDMALLVFDTTDSQSLEFVKDLESNVLTEEMPRVYIGTTSKAMKSGSETPGNEPVLEAYHHCKCMDLEPPLIVSLVEDTEQDSSILEHLVSCAQEDHHVQVSFRSTPHGERNRRNVARRRKVLWIGGLVTAGITVVLGLSLSRKKNMASEKGGWIRLLRKMLPF